MKNILFIIVAMVSVTIGVAQNGKNEAIELEKEILEKARLFGDQSVVTGSLYKIIALEGENSTYKDSLAYVYFSARRYAPCFMVANEVLIRDPKHVGMLEMKGVSLGQLGAVDKSAEVYEELFAVTNNNFHGYNLANLKYSIKKYDEAYTAIKKAEKLNDTGTNQINFTINQNHNQQVELLAAISYLKGLIEIQLDKKDGAVLSLKKAIKIQPDFILAKESLESLEKSPAK